MKLANGQWFIGLPVIENVVLTLYGEKISIVKLGRMPAQMPIVKKGGIRYGHYEHLMA